MERAQSFQKKTTEGVLENMTKIRVLDVTKTSEKAIPLQEKDYGLQMDSNVIKNYLG